MIAEMKEAADVEKLPSAVNLRYFGRLILPS